MTERRGRIPDAPKLHPWQPADYQVADAAALQAVSRGTASADQQLRAYRFIVERLAGTYDMSYRPGGIDGDRDTIFAEGKRFVGTQLVKFANINLAILTKKAREQGPVASPRDTEQPAPRSD